MSADPNKDPNKDLNKKPNYIDARRLLCPLPVIRVQDAVAGLKTGDKVVLSCTDPGVKADIPAWCRINGHEIVDISEQDNEIIITVRVNHDH